MPDSLRFEIYDEVNGVGTTYDFLTAGLKPVIGSWREDRRGNRVMYTVLLVAKDTAANIRSAVNSLEDMLFEANRFIRDALEEESVWYRVQTDGESAKRALVYDFLLEPTDTAAFEIHLEHEAALYALNFTTDGAFEEPTSQYELSPSTLSTLGGTWDLTADITGGNEDGRIAIFTAHSTTNEVNYRKMWIGIRPGRFPVGTGDFDPVFNVTDFAVTGISSGTDANASGGAYRNVSFSGGEELAFKFSNLLSGKSSSWQYYRGRYLVLFRAKVSDGTTTCAVRVSTSFFTPALSDPILLGQTQYISGTAWRFYEMGEIDIPPGRVHSKLDLDEFRINIEAGRIAGSGNLYADCFILIPAHHLFTWDGAEFGADPAIHTPITDAQIFSFPDFTLEAYVVDLDGTIRPGTAMALATPGGKNWRWPIDGGFIVVAAERTTGQVISDQIQLDIEVYRRWTTYRV